MRLLRTYRVLLLPLAFCFVQFGCNKDALRVNFNQLDISVTNPVRTIVKYGDSLVLAGGDKEGFVAVAENDLSNVTIKSSEIKKAVYSLGHFNGTWYFGLSDGTFHYATSLENVQRLYLERKNWVGTEFQHPIRRMITTEDRLHAASGGKLAFGVVYQTDTLLDEWNPISYNHEFRALSVHQSNGRTTVWAGGNGILIKKGDLDKTWERLSIKEGFVVAIEFLNDKLGFVVMYDGEILKSENGGDSWSTVLKSRVNWGVNSLRFFDEVAVISANNGWFAVSEDNGITWKWHQIKDDGIDLLDSYVLGSNMWFGASNGIVHVKLSDLK